MILAAIPIAFVIWAGGAVAIDQVVGAGTEPTVAVEQVETTPADDFIAGE